MAAGMLGDRGEGGTEREVVIYTHVRPDQTMVDVENTRTAVTPDQIQDWCRQAGTTVTVKPVIDLNEEITTDAYEPTERQKEQARLRHPVCPFPLCSRPSRPGTDNDHIIEHPIGPTSTPNLAPLCRGHHRLKTHTDWTYTWVPGIGFVWTSPLGHRHIG